MLSALLVFCTTDFSQCQAVANRQLFKTEEACYNGIAEGIVYFEEQGFLVADYKCVEIGKNEEASK